jgi:hypothetical protein
VARLEVLGGERKRRSRSKARRRVTHR